MRRIEEQRKAAVARAVPYLGIACLALLALAGVRALPVDLAALAGSSGGGTAQASWLGSTGASVPQLGAVRLGRGSSFSGAGLHAPALTVGTLVANIRLAALATTAAPLGFGAFALAALLVAVALALCR